jgi:hypothetical protein
MNKQGVDWKEDKTWGRNSRPRQHNMPDQATQPHRHGTADSTRVAISFDIDKQQNKMNMCSIFSTPTAMMIRYLTGK